MYDCIIVGGGPAGLTAAIYLLRANRRVLVIEKEVFGGAITKSSMVSNYPGFSSISGLDLGTLFYKQAKDLGMEPIYGEVRIIQKEEDDFLVWVSDKVYKSKTLLYATGTSPRKLGVLGEEKFLGKGVSFCATCDGNFFKGKTVVVIGGGNTAVLDALYLAHLCKKVYVVHRREEFRSEASNLELLKGQDNVEFLLSYQVKEILGENEVEGVLLKRDLEEKKIKVDGVFVAIGTVPNLLPLKELLPEVNGYLTEEDVIDGFFPIGDICSKEVRQLTTAVSDGTVGAIKVCEYLEKHS